MDQWLRYVSIISMLVFGSIELYFGLRYSEWSLEVLSGFGAALALFLLTLKPSQDKQHRTRMKH